MADLAAPSIAALTPATVDVAADLALIYDTSAADMRQMTVQNLLYAHQGWVNIADAATIVPNSAFGHNIRFETTLGASRALGTPTNPIDGAVLTLRIKQGGAGSFTLTPNSSYIIPTDITFTLSTTAGLTDVATAVYVGAISKWLILALTKGFAGL